MSEYLFLLGRSPLLSRAELHPFVTERAFDARHHVLHAQVRDYPLLRDIPKPKDQLLLDRLGGTVRLARVVGVAPTLRDVAPKITDIITTEKPEGKVHLGVSGFGVPPADVKHLMQQVKHVLGGQNRNVRIINIDGKPLDSAKIFGEKLLKKGAEFIVWQHGGQVVLGHTVANQNLANYTLRDYRKPHRETKVGMLPPKLAQMLINIANPAPDAVIVDPFCGTGTINVEAALMGYRTLGYDLEKHLVEKSKANFAFLAEKFRFDEGLGAFGVQDARKLSLPEKDKCVLVTEGFLGTNFEAQPRMHEVEEEARRVLKLWLDVFRALEGTGARRMVFCLPAWSVGRNTVSIAQKLFAKVRENSYTPVALFDGRQTLSYGRPDSFVQREVCMVERRG